MAEIVQRRIEERIPELEQLERVGLFTRKEVKCIIKRVTALEYKLHRLILNKEDFTAYVQYEINILELIKKRRAHIHYQFKREEIEHPIIHRINSVFRRATNKWKDDVQLWLSHVAFCKKWATKSQISKVFSSMLAIHPDKPALWILAAKSEMEDRNSSESARHLFLRALRFHPNNQKVYQEYFRMELLHCEKLRKQKMELEKAEMDLVSVHLNFICEAKFVISLLYIAAIFDFTQDLQELILQDLQGNYTEDSFTWDFMAKRELDAPGAGEELQTVKGRASDINRREERCCQVYEEGLKTINTEPMWTCYLAFCLERLKRKTNVQELKEKRQARLLGVFRRAHDCSLLKEEYYKIWILLESGDHEGAASMARAATERYSQSLAAWSLCLQMSMQLESVDMSKLFQDALSHVNPKVHRALRYKASARALLSAVPAVSMEMKERYLDWSYSTGGYKKARKTFKSLQDNRPLSKAFFTTMIQVEKKQDTPKMNNLRGYYERALQEFGTYDDDLWLQYIQEELGPFGQPENCSKIHWRAIKFLEGESVERFISKYTLLQTGH
uniref:UTP6 small subunit processome component n=1 Tax=Takifugu rubripes TaxID=31033 RepID=A0A674NCG7_TAKRU